VQLAQDVVRQMATGFGFTVDVDGYIGVLPAHLFDEGSQIQHSGVQVRPRGEFLIVNRQDERAGPGLLLCKLAQVSIGGHAQHLETLGLDGLRQRPDAQAGGVLRTIVFIDDDDGEAKFHGEKGLSQVGE